MVLFWCYQQVPRTVQMQIAYYSYVGPYQINSYLSTFFLYQEHLDDKSSWPFNEKKKNNRIDCNAGNQPPKHALLVLKKISNYIK